MNAYIVRSFAAGLIIATTICASVYYLGEAENSVSKERTTPSITEMKSMLEKEGYLIYTGAQWDEKLAAEIAVEKEKVDKEIEKNVDESKETQTPDKEKVVYRTVLTVTTGMTSIDVGRALVNAHIIEKANDFSKEVEKKGLAEKLRPGTYEIESGMTMEDVIKIVFK